MNNEFIEKNDYFGLADGTMLVCSSSEDGRSNEVAVATGQDGAIVAHNVYGEKIAPSNEYVMKAVTFSKNEGELAIGQIHKLDDNQTCICLGSLSIGTSAGSAPTISASGEQVEDNSTGNCLFKIPAISLTKKHHAQILFSAFSFSGTGIHLKSASYDITASITKGEKEGKCLTHDVVEGKIECSVEFLSVSGDKPTLTPGDGWEVTSVPSSSNPDADWPTWSATLTKYLTKESEG